MDEKATISIYISFIQLVLGVSFCTMSFTPLLCQSISFNFIICVINFSGQRKNGRKRAHYDDFFLLNHTKFQCQQHKLIEMSTKHIV